MKTKSRYTTLAASLLVALPLGLGSVASAQAETMITAVMQAPLRSLDPVITTAYVIRNYGYMIYDTLLSVDADGNIQPQMLEKWEVSDDGKTYTFTLRDGLKWHDGGDVTSADCIASIDRWATQDKMGQIMKELTTATDRIDDKTFSMTFSTATNIALRALSKPSSLAAFIMPERVARTSPAEPITEAIGSGPFKFVMEEFKPGVNALFVKNDEYVPRSEPASGMAGARIVKVDKVRWVSMPDAMTGVNAIKNGEIDFIEQAPYDLLPLLESDSNIQLIVSTLQGGQPVMRLNHLQPPFDNKLVRQAALAAIDQGEIMQANIGDAKYFRTCAALFGCDTRYGTDAGAGDLVKADAAKSKALLKEAGYDGTPVVIMHPTDFANAGGSFVPVIAQELRQGGFTVRVDAMDWQTLVTRRASQKPIAEGGWNIFTTYLSLADISDPLANYAAASNGTGAWFGWPEQARVEELRQNFATTDDDARLTALATEVQELVMDNVGVVPLGEFAVVGAARASLKGILDAPVPVFWNIEKTGK
ncbi:MAG: ABC transporter substrate-binding protein [Castellaniella sp.]